jgi:hypothetical protein
MMSMKWFACVALIVAIGSTASAQKSNRQEFCSAYFQARADWLATLDGNKATIQTMETYAEILWYSVPRDGGILKVGPSSRSLQSVTITWLMTRWAEQGSQLPLCMEYAECIKCTAALRAVQ